MPKKVAIGVVTSDKQNTTRRVEIPRVVRHAKYSKILHRKTVCHVHDEENASGLGDTVEIVESAPVSKTKRWQLVRVLKKSEAIDLAALRAAQAADSEPQADSESTSAG
jgi:small subunit ribosomal protein S17